MSMANMLSISSPTPLLKSARLASFEAKKFAAAEGASVGFDIHGTEERW